jgi:CheY-like chemotaxis protein
MIFAGKETGSFELVDVSAVVREMLELLKVSITKHAVLKTSLGKALPPLLGIAAQLRQVVMNLVINASEAIGNRDGVIRISTACLRIGDESAAAGTEDLAPGEYLEVEISDTGEGMTQATKSRLFEPFFSTKFAGRGMGLAVVHRIVQRHGGTIHVVSAPGAGTSIRIQLPCVQATVQASRPDVTRDRRVTLPPVRFDVLVVEDESALRTAVATMLRRKGFSVIEASDGTAALDLIRSGEDHIDTMLLDVTLPGASSREVFEEARRLRPNIQVILTSAYSKETVETTFPGIGPGNFIRKPFHIADLLSLFRKPLLE